MAAVDWSGRADGGGRATTWVAEADPTNGRLLALVNGRTREEVGDHLVGLAERAGGRLIVGLDFSFSVPAWWLDRHRLAAADDLWAAAAAHGEAWLADGEWPLWGRAPRWRRPEGIPDPWRRTEHAARALGLRPASTFQVGGAGAVGTGSVRGWPVLARLRAAGFAVWPVHAVGHDQPVAVEVFPRLHAGPVVKSRAWARAAALAGRPGLSAHWRTVAGSSEDAFDATVAVLALADGASSVGTPLVGAPREATREGWIWGVPVVGEPEVHLRV